MAIKNATIKRLMKAQGKLSDAMNELALVNNTDWDEIRKERPELAAVLDMLRMDIGAGIQRAAQILTMVMWPKK